MPRYIDTEELLKVPNVRNVCEYDETGEFISYKAVPVEAIENAPTIEVEPVRHGRWVTDDLGHTHCSRCGERLPFMHCYSDEPCSDYDEEWDEEIPETRHCPNCGAKMDA